MGNGAQYKRSFSYIIKINHAYLSIPILEAEILHCAIHNNDLLHDLDWIGTEKVAPIHIFLLDIYIRTSLK